VYAVEFTEDAREDLRFYRASERGRVIAAVSEQLPRQCSVETRNRKKLRSNPLATWELRIGKYRVFYDVDEDERVVTVIAVGHKEHEKLLVRGREVKT